MSRTVLYVARRGGRLASLRLVGRDFEHAWDATQGPAEVATPTQSAALGAQWAADRLRDEGEPGLGLLCVDADAGLCAWLDAPSPDAAVVAARVREMDEHLTARALARAEDVAQITSVQAILPGAQGDAGRRLAVLSVPDGVPRLLVDALDERGVPQAGDGAGEAARAQDPEQGQAPIADESPVTGAVLVTPDGHSAWAWSRGGRLLAAGRARVDARAPAEHAAARLAADWLAWSAQLGLAPRRLIAVGPDAGGEAGEDWGVWMGDLGRALGRVWTGSSVDVAAVDDPVGATLRRVAQHRGVSRLAPADPSSALAGLSHRPGAAVRGLYRWSAAAVLAAAAGLGLLGYRLHASAGSIRGEASAVRGERRDLVAQVAPEAVDSPFLLDDLNRLIVTREREVVGIPEDEIERAKPVLAELEAFALVLSSTPGVELKLVEFRPQVVTAQVSVPDTPTGDTLDEALNAIDGSVIAWEGRFLPTGTVSRTGTVRQTVLLTGTWPAPARTALAGGSR